MFSEDRLLPISALQHLLFCERQAALIHVEGLWAENRLTVEGRHLHERAHEGPVEARGGVRIARGVLLRSWRLGLTGIADVVEFHSCDDAGGPLERPRVFPVEYKRGRPKAHDADRVQLCAQAICLEEMLGVAVPQGALFYGRTRRREVVQLGDELRAVTARTAARLHEVIGSGRTPVAKKEPKCDQCSLIQLCMPQIVGGTRSASRYLDRMLAGTPQADDCPSPW